MKKLFLILAVAGTLVACNDGSDGSATGDSAVLTTPSTVDSVTVTTPMDSSAVAPMVDTTTSGTGAANSGASGLGNTGAGATTSADSVQK